MNKILLGVICFFVSDIVFANQKAFEIKMDLSMDGKFISSPQIIVKEGEKATVTQEVNNNKSFIEVVASEQLAPNGKTAVLMKFKIGQIANDGSESHVTQTQIMSFENEKAQVSVGESNGKESLSLSVIANKTKH